MRSCASAFAPVTIDSPGRSSPLRSAARAEPSRASIRTSPVTTMKLPAAGSPCAAAGPAATMSTGISAGSSRIPNLTR